MTTDRTAARPPQPPPDARLGSAGGQTNNSSRDAALKGASRAFGKPPVKPKPKGNTYSGVNGALAAATKVGGGGRGGAAGGGGGMGGGMSRPPHEKSVPVPESERVRDERRLEYQNTGGSVSSVQALSRSASKQRASRTDASGFLHPPASGMESAKSPSFIAANLAASRSPSLSPSPTGRQLPAPDLGRQMSLRNRSPSRDRSSSKNGSDRILDTTSIPPTTSLIGMFERGGQPHKQKTWAAGDGADTIHTPSRSMTAPKPMRIHSPLSEPPYEPQQSLISPQANLPSVSPARLAKPVLKAPELPTRESLHDHQQPDPVKSPASSRTPHVTATKPVPIPIPKPKARQAAGRTDSSSTENSFVSASDYQPSPSLRAALHDSSRRLTTHSGGSGTSSATVNSMANAIVASSLASSRAASPSKQLSLQTPPPPPPSRRSPRSHSHLFHNSREVSRTPSPAKQGALRTTMRQPKLEPDVDEGDKRRSKKHIMKKHPNKHHEGDRKRWRDEITERERKRYEAVWASNRGLHVPASHPAAEYAVSSLVVRDIFSRSRLHVDVLEEAYELVDRNHNGVLEREEFVVGLWLIDQRLKGRKLPVKVSDHVWRSVGNLGGIKVRKVGR